MKKVTERQSWMRVLAMSPLPRIQELWRGLEARIETVEFEYLRAPEVGMIMARGRISARGTPFNVGEVTLVRCTVKLPSGETGSAHIKGHNKAHADLAARLDALLQTAEYADLTHEMVIDPLSSEIDEREGRAMDSTEKTRVDCFTMVRGE